ncbi:hypothetical protein TRFO_16373 [Tritrichomonas foetus]|uniref:AATF leucine zipper-containing domain-containing protein n=1 Tax=Tritrichomonas foetus TaxID=1144522 RepID=A0A1J4KQ92_9EUKA|nr:hypothetical protein TRFO_16373 [Tritrichomonas foetus]|eukprot:OHT13411.1 hypothetical protein TRFO_16373 [Tritrichomonas foetus]
MSKPKYKADKIAKQFIPGHQEEEEDDEYSYSDSSELEIDPGFNPSRLRNDAIPTEGEYKGKKTTFAEYEKMNNKLIDDDDDDEEEDEIDDEDDDDDSDDMADFDSDDIPVPAPDGADELEDQLAMLEQEEGEENLVESLRQQQEADLKIAHGTKALQNQYSALMLLRLKLQKVLAAINQLPPTLIPNTTKSPFNIAAQDSEVAQLLGELHESAINLVNEIHEILESIERMYEWQDKDQIADNMMEIISHWGQRLRLSSGAQHGSVINRPIEQQIEAALNNHEALVQPSRHRDQNEPVFGLEEQPEVMSEIYNDYGWYRKIVAESIGASSSNSAVGSGNSGDGKVAAGKPRKQTIRSKQINYEVMPEIQHFMSATMTPIPNYVDALFNSLMK